MARRADVTTPVKAAYARYERRAEQWLTSYRAKGGRVYCGAGCFACCDMPIRVSLAEALVTAEALTPAQVNAVAVHARAVHANALQSSDEDEYVHRHREQVGFCPLLDRHTGSCTQYEARPTRCRDTFSAFPAHYCAAGTWEAMTRRERAEYRREVARTPGTDGEWHFIAPLEHLSEPIWQTAAQAMRRTWGLEVWGDFWVLTTLARDQAFMLAVQQGRVKAAWNVARTRRLAHPMLLSFTP